MIDIILTPNTRQPCGAPKLIHYSAGIFLSILQKGLDVRFIDLISNGALESSSLPEENVADVCCYAVFFGNKVTAFRHMEKIRHAPKAPRCVIAFGVFASVFSEEILSRGLADIVVSLDPEFVIPLILEKGNDLHELSTIPNLSYYHEGEIVHTHKYSFDNLDTIPFIGPYFHSQKHHTVYIMTARGCQHHCVFCNRNALWGGEVRHRSIENVLQEIKELVETKHVQEIEFKDEDLAADPGRLVALCKGIRHIKGDFSWNCSACVDSVSQNLLLLMGRSRCREIYFGVESASPQVLRRLGKTYGRQEILNAVRWGQEAGLNVEVMIMNGNPGETDIDRDMTLSSLQEMGPKMKVITNRVLILPGTTLYYEGLREGWFTQKSFFEDEGNIFYDEKRQLQEDRN